jgi:hypothetical protein
VLAIFALFQNFKSIDLSKQFFYTSTAFQNFTFFQLMSSWSEELISDLKIFVENWQTLVFKMKFQFLRKVLIFLFSFKRIFCLKSIDCSSVVTSNYVSYIGCREFIGTESLTYPKSYNSFVPIYSFKVSKVFFQMFKSITINSIWNSFAILLEFLKSKIPQSITILVII